MPRTEPIPDRATDSFIKFESRSDYNRFIGQLRSQLRSYLINSCEENKVFMQYILEFARENLLVEGRPLTPPPDLSALQNGKSSDQPILNGTSNSRSGNDANQTTTKPCDTALNERVIRQQYALYDAAVANTRKRKDFAPYIAQKVGSAAEQATKKLQAEINQLDQLETERLNQISTDPRQRWEVLNAEIPNMQRTQDDFTTSNQIISRLLKSLPQLIERASNAIKLYEEVANSLKTV